MLEMLLVLAVCVIGVQALIIGLLVGMVNKERAIKKAGVKQSRQMIRILSKLLFEVKRDKDEFEVAYNECYANFKSYYRENKVLKEQLDKLNDIHGLVINNLLVQIKEGKVIKSKYMDKVIPYKFETMTMEEIQQFFGEAK